MSPIYGEFIFYIGYSSYGQYLGILTESGLLSYDDKRQVFKTTEKGLRFLSFYNEIRDVRKELPQSEQQ